MQVLYRDADHEHITRRLISNKPVMQPMNSLAVNQNQEGNFSKRAIRLIVLVGEDLLTTLAAGHAVLLLLAHLGGGELGLLLLAGDLVSHGIELKR